PLPSLSFSTDRLPAPTAPLSLHDALPICRSVGSRRIRSASSGKSGSTSYRIGWTMDSRHGDDSATTSNAPPRLCARIDAARCTRSEEHTSELQSRENLVCRLLLEKKNYNQ